MSKVVVIKRDWCEREREPSKRAQTFVSIESMDCLKDLPRFSSVAQIAEFFSVSPRMVYDWINDESRSNRLQGTKIGRLTKIYRDHLAEFLIKEQEKAS